MTTSNEVSLLDTNVLVYAIDTSSPFHAASKSLRDQGLKGNIALCVSPQVLLEFFTVITNPERVVQPMSPKEAIEEVKKYFKSRKISKIYPARDALERTIALAEKYKVKKHHIFDIQLLATMLSNGVAKIYTHNLKHFSKFKEIKAFAP